MGFLGGKERPITPEGSDAGQRSFSQVVAESFFERNEKNRGQLPDDELAPSPFEPILGKPDPTL